MADGFFNKVVAGAGKTLRGWLGKIIPASPEKAEPAQQPTEIAKKTPKLASSSRHLHVNGGPAREAARIRGMNRDRANQYREMHKGPVAPIKLDARTKLRLRKMNPDRAAEHLKALSKNQAKQVPAKRTVEVSNPRVAEMLHQDSKLEQLARLRGVPQNPLHFSAEEYKKHLNLWSSVSPENPTHDKEGIHFKTKSGNSVHIQRNKIVFDSSADDATLRAVVLHAKENWNKGMTPNNMKPEQLAKLWAHSQVHGVTLVGWEPSPEVAEKMKPVIARLREQEDKLVAEQAASQQIQMGTASQQSQQPKAKAARLGL